MCSQYVLVKNGIAESDLNEFIINKNLFAGDTCIWVKTHYYKLELIVNCSTNKQVDAAEL